MSEHTPGPWSVQPHFLTVYSFRGATSGLTCAVASVILGQVEAGEEHANANLIAAAPDLLAALENLLALVQGQAPHLLEDDHDYELVAAAIAKARGEA